MATPLGSQLLAISTVLLLTFASWNMQKIPKPIIRTSTPPKPTVSFLPIFKLLNQFIDVLLGARDTCGAGSATV